MSHEKISSFSEPWILLPFVYALKEKGQLSEYSHTTCFKAISEFVHHLPNQMDDYHLFLRNFAKDIYGSFCSKGEVYFLDKTPRYYLIIPEIVKIFPEAKFIFLFRNPVQVYSSILNTWLDNRFRKIHRYYIDLMEGPRMLTSGYSSIKNISHRLRYEDLVEKPAIRLRGIFNYLNLDFDENLADVFFKQKLSGRMGDQRGAEKYKKIEDGSLKKWETTFSTPFRKMVLKNYIHALDGRVLKKLGYEKSRILKEIEQISIIKGKNSFLTDLFDFFVSHMARVTNLNMPFQMVKAGSTRIMKPFH